MITISEKIQNTIKKANIVENEIKEAVSRSEEFRELYSVFEQFFEDLNEDRIEALLDLSSKEEKEFGENLGRLESAVENAYKPALDLENIQGTIRNLKELSCMVDEMDHNNIAQFDKQISDALKIYKEHNSIGFELDKQLHKGLLAIKVDGKPLMQRTMPILNPQS